MTDDIEIHESKQAFVMNLVFWYYSINEESLIRFFVVH